MRDGFAAQGAPHDGVGAADARVDIDGSERAVAGASAAFHAAIPVGDPGPAAVHFENRVRADGRAQAAAGAPVRMISERRDVFQMSERHARFLMAAK